MEDQEHDNNTVTDPAALIGEVVRLKSGGHLMTIAGVDPGKGQVLVTWAPEAATSTMPNAVLPIACLVRVAPQAPPRVGGPVTVGGPVND